MPKLLLITLISLTYAAWAGETTMVLMVALLSALTVAGIVAKLLGEFPHDYLGGPLFHQDDRRSV